MIRRISFGALVAAVLIVGLVAQAGAYLLAFTSPVAETDTGYAAMGSYVDTGAHPVGVRRMDTPTPFTVWYPAIGQPGSSVTYSYAFTMFGPESPTALATYSGRAGQQAPFDLAAGPYPLVVLSPGFAITASSYAWLAEHLASYGMVVVAPEHRESLDPGVLWRSTFNRPHDTQAVLRAIDDAVQPGGVFEDLVDSQMVAIVGHSYGGYTALAAAGARIDTDAFEAACGSARAEGGPLVFLCDALGPRLDDIADMAGLGSVPPGLWPAWSDERIDAVVSMAGDAAMFGAEGLAEVTVPVLAIGGTADTDSPFDWGTRLTYENVSSERKIEVSLEGAGHLIFAGECHSVRRILDLVSLGFCSDPGWDRAQGQRLVRHLVTAFLLSTLADEHAATSALASGGRGITSVGYRSEGY